MQSVQKKEKYHSYSFDRLVGYIKIFLQRDNIMLENPSRTNRTVLLRTLIILLFPVLHYGAQITPIVSTLQEGKSSLETYSEVIGFALMMQRSRNLYCHAQWKLQE